MSEEKKQVDLMADEHDKLLDHEYDGIRELNNHMPTWWVLGFYFSIVFAVMYLLIYEVTDWGPSSTEEYEQQMVAAQASIDAYMAKKQALEGDQEPQESIDLAVILTDAESLARGKEAYMKICFACHGNAGEGGVGPNLTDNLWIHGCEPGEIAQSIKTGFPQKGMPPYGGGMALDDKQLREVSSYILSLQGSNPPNAKGADPSRAVECTPKNLSAK